MNTFRGWVEKILHKDPTPNVEERRRVTAAIEAKSVDDYSPTVPDLEVLEESPEMDVSFGFNPYDTVDKSSR